MGKLYSLKSPTKKKGFIKSNIINTITIRDLKISDMFGLDFVTPTEQMRSMCMLISRLSGLDLKVIEDLSSEDYMALSTIISNMIDGKK